MRLDKNYELTSDTYNWILNYEGDTYEIEKDGKIKTITPKDTFYYSTISAALSAFLDKSLKGADEVNNILLRIKEVQDIIETIKKEK